MQDSQPVQGIHAVAALEPFSSQTLFMLEALKNHLETAWLKHGNHDLITK